jgi:hypothetical protein
VTWAALGESATGTAHARAGGECQDHFRVLTPWDSLVIAVADGAGSATHSAIGARIACDELVRVTDPPRTREEAVERFAAARDAIFAEAGRLGVPPRELACTALLIVLGPAGGAVVQVGDGAAVLGGRVVFWPDPAEYANATDFLTDDRFPAAVRFEPVDEPVAEVAAFTDGLQRLALDFAARTPHPGFFAPLFAALRAAADPDALREPFRAFLDSDRVNARTDDDKTLVLAVRR